MYQSIEDDLQQLFEFELTITEPFPPWAAAIDGDGIDIFPLKRFIETQLDVNDFIFISMADMGFRKREGDKDIILEIHIKTNEALQLFKSLVASEATTLSQTKKKKEANLVPGKSNIQDSPFFSSNKQKMDESQIAVAPISFTANEIADAFGFDPSLIIEVKKGLVKSFEIHTKDVATALNLGNIIRDHLYPNDKNKNRGWLRPGGIFSKEPLVEINFDALSDFTKYVLDYRSNTNKPT